MKQVKKWSRSEWMSTVAKALDKASPERDSSRALIGNAEDELEDVKDMLRRLSPGKEAKSA